MIQKSRNLPPWFRWFLFILIAAFFLFAIYFMTFHRSVKTPSPEAVVAAYWDLISKNDYNKAVLLYTARSRETFTAQTLKNTLDSSHIKALTPEKIFPAVVRDNIAVVGFLLNERIVAGHDSSVIAIYPDLSLVVLKKEAGQWRITTDSQDLTPQEIAIVNELLITHTEQIKKQVDIEAINQKQKEAVKLLTPPQAQKKK